MTDLDKLVKEAKGALEVLGRMWPHNHHHPEETAGALGHIRQVGLALDILARRVWEEESKLKGREDQLREAPHTVLLDASEADKVLVAINGRLEAKLARYREVLEAHRCDHDAHEACSCANRTIATLRALSDEEARDG